MSALKTAQIAYEFYKYEIIKNENYNRNTGKINYYYFNKDNWNRGRNNSHLLQEVNSKCTGSDNFFTALSNYLINTLNLSVRGSLNNAAEDYKKFIAYKSQAIYFSDAFYTGKDFDELKAFSIIRLLGNVRQSSFHENGVSAYFYNLDKSMDSDVSKALNSIVESKIESINDNFAATNTVNLTSLFDIYKDEDKGEIVKQYYDFSVRKEFKNLGFSVKKLRESILEFDKKEIQEITGKKYDSVRSKFYSLFDFVIYRYYLENEEKAEGFVNALRETKTEEDKVNIYNHNAHEIWKWIGDTVLNEIKPKMDGDYIKKIDKIDRKNPLYDLIQSNITKHSNLDDFAKAMYCVCMFLDGKDINIFLCDLINKLDNIASFIDVLEYKNIDVSLKKEYKFFMNSKKLAEDLRFVKSLARMNLSKKAISTNGVKANGERYYSVAAFLGETDKEKIDKAFCLGEYHADEKEYSKREIAEMHSFRNFVINNVLNSNRYIYAVRFINPADARKIMGNKALVKFVLKDIPETQLTRYCKTVDIMLEKDVTAAKMAELLADKLQDVTFDNLSVVKQNSTLPSENMEKERLKALVGLYLTVLYILVKSMVKFNMSYTIALGILERDYSLLKNVIGASGKIDNNYDCITNYYMNQGKISRHIMDGLYKEHHNGKNVRYYDNTTFKMYRNNIAHFSIIANFAEYAKNLKRCESYFDIYHYVAFMLLIKDHETALQHNKDIRCGKAAGRFWNIPLNNAVMQSVTEKVKSKQEICTDYVKAVNLPFAYNAAWYTNLAVREQFLRSYGK